MGKRGMTCLEISKGNMRLIHWFDYAAIAEEGLIGKPAKALPTSGIHRQVLRKASLNWIMDSLRLLI